MSRLIQTFRRLARPVRAFLRHRRGNVAMMFALSLVPLSMAAGAGLDYWRAVRVRQQMSEALDAAALAVGSSPGLSLANATALAQKYFAANYDVDASYGTPVVSIDATNGYNPKGSVTVTAADVMPTTVLAAAGAVFAQLFGGEPAWKTLNVSTSSTVVWGQTKIWVGLVLDNTGSMCEPDSNPCPNDASASIKINALKTASHNLLNTLQNASANPGDVLVSIVPFAKDVKVGTANVDATWIDWTDWATAPSSAPSSSVGPGSSCPWSGNATYNGCLDKPGGTLASDGITMTTVNTIPASGTYSGYICPASVRSSSSGQTGHYYDGCWTSVPTKSLNTAKTVSQPMKDKQTCTQAGSGAVNCTDQSGWPQTNGNPTTSTSTSTTNGYTGDSTSTATQNNQNSNNSDGSKSCKTSNRVQTCTWTRTVTYSNNTVTTTVTGAAPYTHAWKVNDHSTWRGCVMDRDQSDDADDTTPGTKFPAENSDSCPIAQVTPMSNPTPSSSSDVAAMFVNLNAQIDAMVANGGTNQTIGLAHGMQTLTAGDPYNAPTLPPNTTRYIILLSDGLNTMDRWYGNGSSQSNSVDDRMKAACANAKAQGFVIYAIFVDLNGTQGNSSVLQNNCASDQSKYFDLKTSSAIISTFDQIAQQITNVRVSQ
ncbi:MAG TPA: pilus assembly protein [Rhizomicrobium sp.]